MLAKQLNMLIKMLLSALIIKEKFELSIFACNNSSLQLFIGRIEVEIVLYQVANFDIVQAYLLNVT